MREQITCYDAYDLFTNSLNSKPVTEREKALCRAFFQAAWEAKTVELSASQAREAELQNKLEAAEARAFELIVSSHDKSRIIVELKRRAEAAEARIKASWEQEPVAFRETITGLVCLPTNEHRIKYANCYEPLYKQPPIPPELTELQHENAELRGRTDSLEVVALRKENTELTRLLEEAKSKAVSEGVIQNDARYRFLRRTWAEPAVLDALNTANPEPESDEEFDAAIDKAMLAAAPQPEDKE